MTSYLFSSVPAVDPVTSTLLRNTAGVIYAAADDTFAAPLPITDATGVPLTEVRVGDLGLTEEFVTQDHGVVRWKSGNYVITLASINGMLSEAVAARDEATAARAAAETAAENAVAPAVEAIFGSAGFLATLESEVGARVDAADLVSASDILDGNGKVLPNLLPDLSEVYMPVGAALGQVTGVPAVVLKNMYDPTAAQVGFVLSGPTGTLSPSASYTTTGYIPVTAGQAYTVSNPRSVYHYDANQTLLSRLIDNPGQTVYTFTASATGFIRASFITATYASTFQVEKGSSATAYAPYSVSIPSLVVPHAQLADLPLTLVRAGDDLTLSTLLGSSPLTLYSTLKRTTTNFAYNINQTTRDAVLIHGVSNLGDEVTPVRTQFGTVGGNHGLSTSRGFTNPDGKTVADLGSRWTDGAREYVLLAIDSSGKLILGGGYTTTDGIATTLAVAPVGNLTHVAGATLTGTLVASTMTIVPLLPTTTKVRVAVFADGVQVTGNGTVKGRSVQIRESYEVYDYADLYDKAKANIGVPFTSIPNVATILRVTNVFTFTAGGRCRVRSELTAIKKTQLGACGFVQSVALQKSGATIKRYLPGVGTIGGLNWGAGVDLASHSADQVVTSANLLSATVPPIFSLDRVIESSATTFGFALGYLPFTADDTSNAARLAATPSNLWDLRGTDKSYPTALNTRVLNPGDRATAESFRVYLTAAQTDAVVAAGPDALSAWATLDSVAALSGSVI